MKVAQDEQLTLHPDFWNNPEKAQEILKEIQINKNWIKIFEDAWKSYEELEVLREFYDAGEASEQELEQQYQSTLNWLEELEFKSTLNSEEDKLSAILEINAGAGGTESCDWASMLYRMYLMWAEKHGYTIKEVERNDGDVAGLKSASLEILGDFAYGYLKGENGVHRLVRVSPFDSNAKRHTSFASVFVYPIIDDTIEIKVADSELEWDTFRSSGAGGQNVNKVETAVRVRHLPSGIVVTCQIARSQHENRETALRMLKSKLYDLEVQKRNEQRDKLEGTKLKIEWGSQIRNYVLHPYKLVKDTRTGFESTDPQSVLDGELDDFIKTFLLHATNKKS
jgi:peptide chain release factor 2